MMGRPNPRLVAVLVAGVLLAIAGGWFGLKNLMDQSTRAEELGEKRGRGEIAAILGRAGGNGAAKKEMEDLRKLSEALTEHEKEVVTPWQRAWAEASGEGKDWSKDPNKWKDKLVKDNDEIAKRCVRNGDPAGVSLGANFYLGMEEYKQKSPAAEQVPDLARKLAVSRKLADLLLEAKRVKEGYSTPCVLSKIEDLSQERNEKPEAGKEKGKEDKNGSISRDHYRVLVECSPEVLYEYVRLLGRSDWLFIITNLSVVNTRESFPKRGELAKLFEQPPVAEDQGSSPVRGTGEKTGEKKLLLVLSGKEQVRVALNVDFIGWQPASGKGKATGQKK